jgi:hypothetical protein
MTIREVVTKHYCELLSKCTKTDIALYAGRTSEDLLGDAVLTAINKFGDAQIEEQDGYDYLRKTFLESCFFAYKKKGYSEEKILQFVEDYPDV